MRKHLFTAVALMLLSSLNTWAQDEQILSEQTPIGTARYTAMAGAMASVGADPSAVQDNPAGLGLYRRMEVGFTVSEQITADRQAGQQYSRTNGSFMLPQASIVFALENGVEDSPMRFCNFMLSYHRRQSWNRSSYGNSVMQPSISNLMLEHLGSMPERTISNSNFQNDQCSWLSELGYQTYMVDPVWDINSSGDTIRQMGWAAPYTTTAQTNIQCDESGYSDIYSAYWAANFNHHWHLGLGVNLHSLYYFKHMNHREWYASGADMQLHSYLRQSGIGASGSIGLIYQPIQMVRMGLSLQTPVGMRLRTTTWSSMQSHVGGKQYDCTTPDYATQFNIGQPLRLTLGTTVIFGRKGLVSVQYDYRHWRGLQDMHTIKLGGECVVAKHVFINAGYACESPFKKDQNEYLLHSNDVRTDSDVRRLATAHIAAAGFGYRGQLLSAQIAYQFRYQRYDLYPYTAATSAPQAMEMHGMTHRVVFSMSWHSAR